MMGMLLVTVFLLSFSTIAIEILLTRIFSITQWNHLSFMVISIALFGFAAAGTFLSITDHRRKITTRNIEDFSLALLVGLYACAAIIVLFCLNALPLDYFRLPLEPLQLGYLFLAYLMLSIPFFFAGMVISLAYSYLPQKTALIYFAVMLGSACGAILPGPLVPILSEEKLIIAAALMPLVIFPALGLKKYTLQPSLINKSGMRCILVLTGIGLCVGLYFGFLTVTEAQGWLQSRPSAYKSLSQLLRAPDTTIAETTHSIRGRLDRVVSPYIRYAPGLSLKYTESMPPQSAVFKDGNHRFVLYDLLRHQDRLFPRQMLAYIGYHLNPAAEEILIVPDGGGASIACAIAANAKTLDIVVPDPVLVDMLQRHYRQRVICANPRSFVRQTQKRYDIIHLEAWGTSLIGSTALTQQHLLTINAFNAYLDRLSPNGVLIVSRRLLLPPSDAMRTWSAAFESLMRAGVKRPARHLAMIRNWDTYTLLVFKAPVSASAKIKSFAKARNFDLVFLPALRESEVNQFNQFDSAFHFSALNRVQKAYETGTTKAFFDNYLLDVRPQTDNRPFPGRFLKWFNLRNIYQQTGSRFYSLILSGEVVVAVVLVEALFVSLVLLIMPVMIISRRAKRLALIPSFYFFCVGTGFLFIEMFFIKRFTLLFGDPVISFSVVLSGMLAFSAIGGYLSHGIELRHLPKAILTLLAWLVILVLANSILCGMIIRFSLFWRYFSAFLLLLPTGVLMGVLFPAGMRELTSSPMERAFGWAVNGCASVLAAVLAAQIAVGFGVQAILAGGMVSYLFAFFAACGCMVRFKKILHKTAIN